MDEGQQQAGLCGGGSGGRSGVEGTDQHGERRSVGGTDQHADEHSTGDGLNFEFSYESILNNDIVRPQEIDCGMSCASSFFEGSERVSPGGDYAMDAAGGPPSCAISAPPLSARNSSALEFSFQRDAAQGEALHRGSSLGGEAPQGEGHPHGGADGGREGGEDGGTDGAANGGRDAPQPSNTFTQKEEISPGELPPGELPPGELPPGELPPGELPPGELPPGEEPLRRGPPTATSGETCLVSPTMTSTDKQGRYYKSSPSISSTRTSDVSEANEIYRSLQTEIASYKMKNFHLRSEAQVQSSYLVNERKKNEEYVQMLQRFLLEPSGCSQQGNDTMGSLNLLDVENKKLRQELALKSSEVIELSNLVNNLKDQKVIFMNSLQNELEMCINKEAEASLMLHAQTKRLANANNFIAKQNRQISQLKEEILKVEETYILHVNKLESRINQLLEERNEFVSTAKRLEVINLESRKKDEELSKCRQRCKELSEELNDLLRIVSAERDNRGANFGGFYEDGHSISSFASLQGGFLSGCPPTGEAPPGGNPLREENIILAKQLQQMIQQNDALKAEVAQQVQDLQEVTTQLESHKQTIKEKNQNYTLLLNRYNSLEQDFENVHLLCMQLEERFRVEHSSPARESGGGKGSGGSGGESGNRSGNHSRLLSRSNFSLSDLDLNHSQQSESDIQHYKIFCSELQLENESLKQAVQRLKSKNRKLTTSMELLLRDLVAGQGGTHGGSHDSVHGDSHGGATEESASHGGDQESPPPGGGQTGGAQTEGNHPMEERTKRENQTEGIQTEGVHTEGVQTEGRGGALGESQTEGRGGALGGDPPNRSLISQGVNTEEKVSASKQVYTHENRSFVSSGTNTNGVDVTDVGVDPNVINLTDVGVDPNVINLTDVGVDPNVIDLTDVGTSPEEEMKGTQNREVQTEELNSHVKFTQTDESSSANREVLTDLHGMNICSVKRIMLACSASKNKKVQVTTTTMNASVQTVEATKRGKLFNWGVCQDVLYDRRRDRRTTRRIKKRQHVKGGRDSLFCSDEGSTGGDVSYEGSSGGDVSYESGSTSSTSAYAHFRCTEKKRKKEAGEYSTQSRFKGDWGGHLPARNRRNQLTANSRKNHLPARRRRVKANCNSLGASNSYALPRGKKPHRKSEREEVESLIEILKYSSDNCEPEVERYDELNFGSSRGSFHVYSSDHSRVRLKRREGKQRRHLRRTRKQVGDISEEDSIEGGYPPHKRTTPRGRMIKRPIMSNIQCRSCHPQCVIVKENKHVQTGEYFLESEFNFAPSSSSITPMGSPPCNVKKNIRTLKRKVKEYHSDYYDTLIICEHCKGVYVDVLTLHIVREYLARIGFRRCCGGKAEGAQRGECSEASTDEGSAQLSGECSDELSGECSGEVSGECSGEVSGESSGGHSGGHAATRAANQSGGESANPPAGALEALLIKRIPLKLPICTCTLVNLKYKKVLVRKEESAARVVRRPSGRLPSRPAKRKTKNHSVNISPQKEQLNRALLILNQLRVELKQIKCFVCNFLLLNERNELHRILLTSPRLTDVLPFLFRKYTLGGESECFSVVASSGGLPPSGVQVSTGTHGNFPHCASNSRGSHLTGMNPFMGSMLASTNDGGGSFADVSTPLCGVTTEEPHSPIIRRTYLLDGGRIANHGALESSSSLYSLDRCVNQANHNELCSEVATHKSNGAAHHSGSVPHRDHFVRQEGEENVTLFAIWSVLRLHELHVEYHIRRGGVGPSNGTGGAAEVSTELGGSFPKGGTPPNDNQASGTPPSDNPSCGAPPSCFTPPSGVDSFFEPYLPQLGGRITPSDERTSLTLIMRDVVKHVEENWKAIASVHLHLNEPLSAAPMRMADVLRLIRNYAKVGPYLSRLPNGGGGEGGTDKRPPEGGPDDLGREDLGREDLGGEVLSGDDRLAEWHRATGEHPLILRLKEKIEQLAEEKEATNKLLREAVEDKERYSQLCAALQQGRKPAEEGGPHKEKIDSCISRIDELHAEIEALKQQGGGERGGVGGGDGERGGGGDGDGGGDGGGDGDAYDDGDCDDARAKRPAAPSRASKRKTAATSSTLQGGQVDAIYNAIIILRNSITHLVTYVHKKIWGNARISLNHIRQLYTHVVNVLLDLPKELGLAVVFVRKREINFDVYIKKGGLSLEAAGGWLPMEKRFPSRDSLLALPDASQSDGSSLEGAVSPGRRKKKKKKKKKMTTPQMRTRNEANVVNATNELSERHSGDEAAVAAVAASQKKRKGGKKKVVQGAHCLVNLADVSDQVIRRGALRLPPSQRTRVRVRTLIRTFKHLRANHNTVAPSTCTLLSL
ncbi:conserved Plasmodium protein, unknown function [Plasmodium vivax]|nr:conserved Plasmodium protein, unknown function [Plasmodium vivax]